MVLDNGEEELDLTMKLNVNSFEYIVYATTDALLKCFHCGCVGHVVRDCPHKKSKVSEPNLEGPPAESSTGAHETRESTADIYLIAEEPVAAAGGSTPAVSNDNAVNLITKELTALSECKTDGRPVLETPTENASANAKVSGLLSPEPAQDVEMSGGFKIPFKRKTEDSPSCVPRAKKGDEHDSDEESVCSNVSDSSLGEVCASGGDLPLQYKAEDISRFFYMKRKGFVMLKQNFIFLTGNSLSMMLFVF